MHKYAIACLSLSLIVPGWGFAEAQEEAAAAPITIELNKLEAIDDGCRAYLKIENPRAERFDNFELDLVTFQPDGVIGSQFLIELAPLPAEKTVVKPFELRAVDCASISSVLLNDVPNCSGAGVSPANCIEIIEVSSLTSDFWK